MSIKASQRFLISSEGYQCNVAQLPEGEFVKGFVQDVLKQLGAGGGSFPQQIIQLGMQGVALIAHSSSVRSLEEPRDQYRALESRQGRCRV